MVKLAFVMVAALGLMACASQPEQALQRDPNAPRTLPGKDNPYAPNTVIVIATPGFPWAAKNVADVVSANAVSPEISYFAARNLVMYNDNVVGLIEVNVDVDNVYESVSAVCRDKETRTVWQETRVLNFAGGRESLARSMVGALVTKVAGKTCP
jgi:hypothetical protein